MTDIIINKIIDSMISENVISEEFREIYIYTFRNTIQELIVCISIMVLSLLNDMFINTLIFLSTFILLRKRTGGYHAKSFLNCYLLSILSYIIVIKIIYPLFMGVDISFIFVCTTCSVGIIYFIGTINHPNWDLNDIEYKSITHMARKLVCILYIIFVGGVALNVNTSYIVMLSIALLLCAFTMILSKLCGQEKEVY